MSREHLNAYMPGDKNSQWGYHSIRFLHLTNNDACISQYSPWYVNRKPTTPSMFGVLKKCIFNLIEQPKSMLVEIMSIRIFSTCVL